MWGAFEDPKDAFCPTRCPSPLPEARDPMHSQPFVPRSQKLQEGGTVSSISYFPCNLNTLEFFCRTIICCAEKGEFGDMERQRRKKMAVFGGQRRKTQRGRGPRETAPGLDWKESSEVSQTLLQCSAVVRVPRCRRRELSSYSVCVCDPTKTLK